MTNHRKTLRVNGVYTINRNKYSLLIGSRVQVYHGTAYKTSGGLTKSDLLRTNKGRIVSKKKHTTAKKEKRLEQHGFFTEKGKFGWVKKAVGFRRTAKARR